MFSLVVMPALFVAAVMLAGPVPNVAAGYLLAEFTVALAGAGVFSLWVLLAALLALRPAWRHPVARWVWVWTLLCCAGLGLVGLARPTNTLMSSVLLYACGMLALISGLPGLLVAALPTRIRRDFYGREM